DRGRHGECPARGMAAGAGQSAPGRPAGRLSVPDDLPGAGAAEPLGIELPDGVANSGCPSGNYPVNALRQSTDKWRIFASSNGAAPPFPATTGTGEGGLEPSGTAGPARSAASARRCRHAPVAGWGRTWLGPRGHLLERPGVTVRVA